MHAGPTFGLIRSLPNATIVFVNLLFSNKTQEIIMPIVGLNSSRKGGTIANKGAPSILLRATDVIE